jgi:hypothetical protein
MFEDYFLVVYFTAWSVSQNIQHRILWYLAQNALERIWREVVVVWSKAASNNFQSIGCPSWNLNWTVLECNFRALPVINYLQKLHLYRNYISSFSYCYYLEGEKVNQVSLLFIPSCCSLASLVPAYSVLWNCCCYWSDFSLIHCPWIRPSEGALFPYTLSSD